MLDTAYTLACLLKSSFGVIKCGNSNVWVAKTWFIAAYPNLLDRAGYESEFAKTIH